MKKIYLIPTTDHVNLHGAQLMQAGSMHFRGNDNGGHVYSEDATDDAASRRRRDVWDDEEELEEEYL